MVYARTVAQKTFSFQVSGMLWRNSLIMVDRETGTLWSHVTGAALKGSEEGAQLVKLPSVQTTWRRWRADHPGTRVLRKSEEVLSSHYEKYFGDPDRMGLFRSRWLMEKMPGKEKVYGAAIGPHAVAVTDAALEASGLVAVDLGGTPVVVVRGADGGVRAFEAAVDGDTLRFSRQDGVFRDDGTGSSWDLGRGAASHGDLAGRSLEPVVVTTSFWFAWSSFYPNTQVIE